MIRKMESFVSFPGDTQSYFDTCGTSLRHWATKYPDRQAFVCYGKDGNCEKVSANEVFQKSVLFSEFLKRNGFTRGEAVVICMKRSIDAIIALYGTCCAGGECYVFDDVADFCDVRNLLLENSNVKILCTDWDTNTSESGLFESILGLENGGCLKAIVAKGQFNTDQKVHIVQMSDILSESTTVQQDNTCISNQEHCAVLFQTQNDEGSEFVGSRTDSLFCASANAIKRLAGNGDSIWFSDESFAHALAAPRCYIASGCTQVFVEEDVKKQTNYIDTILDLIRAERCSHLFASPLLIGQLLQLPRVTALPSVHSLVSSVVESGVTDGMQQMLGITCQTLAFMYEYQNILPVSMVSLGDRTMVVEGLVGQPLPGVSIKIINEHGKTVARETIGFLCFQVRCPLYTRTGSSQPDAWIRSGYVARMRTDGSTVLIGRESKLITLDKKQFFAHQVERIILRCPGVESVAVLVVPNRKSRKVLCACLVVDEEEFDMDFLETFCDGIWSTVNMLTTTCRRPNCFLSFKEFPKNSQGDVDNEVLMKEVKSKLWPDPVQPVSFF